MTERRDRDVAMECGLGSFVMSPFAKLDGGHYLRSLGARCGPDGRCLQHSAVLHLHLKV